MSIGKRDEGYCQNRDEPHWTPVFSRGHNGGYRNFLARHDVNIFAVNFYRQRHDFIIIYPG